jgi:hypothetical protein
MRRDPRAAPLAPRARRARKHSPSHIQSLRPERPIAPMLEERRARSQRGAHTRSGRVGQGGRDASGHRAHAVSRHDSYQPRAESRASITAIRQARRARPRGHTTSAERGGGWARDEEHAAATQVKREHRTSPRWVNECGVHHACRCVAHAHARPSAERCIRCTWTNALRRRPARLRASSPSFRVVLHTAERG